MDYEQLKKLFLSGVSLEQLGKQYKVNPYGLGKKLKQDGVVIPLCNRKYNYIDEDFFDVIDTEEKAYWLGFLYADGYIDKRQQVLEVALAAVDHEHIQLLANTLVQNIPIKKRTYNNYVSYRVLFGNRRLVRGLVKNGCVNCKSKILKFPELPSDLVRHFIRGFFDGDGSIMAHGMSLCCGTESFLQDIQTIFANEIPAYTSVKLSKDSRAEVWSLQKGSPRCALKVLHYLYGDASIYLKRKYLKYKTLSKHKPSRAEMRKSITGEKTGNPEMGIRPEGEHEGVSQGQRLGDEITPPRDSGTQKRVKR